MCGGGGGKEHCDSQVFKQDKIQTEKEQQENEGQKKSDSGLGSTVSSSVILDHGTQANMPPTPQRLTSIEEELSSNSSNTSSPNHSSPHTQEKASRNEEVMSETDKLPQEEYYTTMCGSEEPVVPPGATFSAHPQLVSQSDATSFEQERPKDDKENFEDPQELHSECDSQAKLATIHSSTYQKIVAIPPPGVTDEGAAFKSTSFKAFISFGEPAPRPLVECDDFSPSGRHAVTVHENGTGSIDVDSLVAAQLPILQDTTSEQPAPRLECTEEMHSEVYTETASAQQTSLQETVKYFVALAEHDSLEDPSCSKPIEESNSSAHCQGRPVFIRTSVSCYEHAHIII